MFLVQGTRVGYCMPRLIAFGCSFTYGQSMPDCFKGKDIHIPADEPSKFAWPAVLSNMLGVECVNQSKCGASNLEILYRILDFKFKKDDIVVIMWSMPDRDLFFRQIWGPFRQLGVWMSDRLAKKWITSVDEYDYIQRAWIYMHHADLYLKTLNIQYIHYPAHVPKIESLLSNIIIDNLHLNGQVVCDYALDGIHSGIESHKQTAIIIFNILHEHTTS